MMDGVAEGSHGSYLQRSPVVFPGYSIQGFHCVACDHEWYGLALVGTVGVTCPKCGLLEERFVWPKPDVLMAHDGAWLTAHWDLPVYTAPSTAASGLRSGCEDEDDEDMDPETGEPRNWLKRWAQRIRCAFWALRGEY